MLSRLTNITIAKQSCPEGGDLTAISPGRWVVSSIRIAPRSAMKGSPDLIPAAELDPRRVCKGKGVVTLRATLVHIDEDDRVSKDPRGHAPPGGWTKQINGDIAEAGLAEGGSHVTADLPSVNHTHWLVPSAHRVNENQAPVSAGVQNRITAPRGSAYPSTTTTTTTISPDIVLLQQNREQQKHLSPSEGLPLESHTSPEPGRDFPASTCDPVSSDMDGKRMRLSLHSPVTSPRRQPVAPVRNTDKSKDWYKSMFKQIHRIPETPEENPYRPTYIFPENYDRLVVRSKDDGLSPLGYLEEVKGVPRSKSDAEFDSRGRLMPVPTRSSSLKPTTKRNEWEPPDKKVDTRKYRAEPRASLSTSQGSRLC
ncbi:sorbin and SH3 domain-containing protein 1-like isoform X1 [Gadus macrocephalus]|uniref:sorbin and SH3 domain-containing protein 1-like isoform X1 n=2 Tax=Gadus macrocephalus TaxID=80720 RepID=UPI0028CB6749|nr:sorbin and SH3 domain-containing protein 1-like isoform X1 [Gadus macrocephalus]